MVRGAHCWMRYEIIWISNPSCETHVALVGGVYGLLGPLLLLRRW